MSSRDWFRNTNWNAAIAAEFERRLKRSRTQKAEYLRIQASCLVKTHPNVALDLSARFLALPKPYLVAVILNTRARALVVLGRVNEAISTYEAVLDGEKKEVGAGLTDAYLDYAELILTKQLTHGFERARAALHERADRPTFPVQHFRYHSLLALLAASQKLSAEARLNARAALEAASQGKSGFRHHPKLGLVGEGEVEALRRLRELCDA